jgi:flagellar protein FliS
MTVSAAYRTAEVATISQRDLIVKLYRGAENYLALAQEAMHGQRIEAAHLNCQKARAIFFELMSTLNFEQGGEIAARLRDLYSFLIFQIVEANLTKDPEKLEALKPTLSTLREAWEQIPDSLANVSSIPQENDGHTCNFKV